MVGVQMAAQASGLITRSLNKNTHLKSSDTLQKAAQVALQEPDAIKQRGAGRPITRRAYPILVMLKLAGRSPKEIAQIFGKDTPAVQGHIARAMSEYRQGRIQINNGEAVSEARAKGEEESVQTLKDAYGNDDEEKVKSTQTTDGNQKSTPRSSETTKPQDSASGPKQAQPLPTPQANSYTPTAGIATSAAPPAVTLTSVAA